MLNDIVIDTNVFIHSQNQNEPRHDDCCTLLDILNKCQTKLCVDEGFSLIESKNLSFIGTEYLNNIHHGSLAFSILANLAASKRVKFLPKRAPEREQRIINQKIRKPVDRTFLGVAYNSGDHILVSHDYEDFQNDKRIFIRKKLDVEIIEVCDTFDYF